MLETGAGRAVVQMARSVAGGPQLQTVGGRPRVVRCPRGLVCNGMSRYLLVAHQTAHSEELLRSAQELARQDPQAEFVLLVPSTPVASLLVWEEGETAEVAGRRAASAQARLEQGGLRVVEARSGDPDPVAAIGDEIHAGRRYAAIVVSTLPAGISRWVRMDVIHRVQRNYPGQPVIHVVAGAAAETRAT